MDSSDFQEVKRIMLFLPELAKRDTKVAPFGNSKAPAAPSARTIEFNSNGVRLRHPDNWKSSVQGTHATIAPDAGIINGNLAYGMIVDVFQHQGAADLDQATAQPLNQLTPGNAGMQPPRSRVQTKRA